MSSVIVLLLAGSATALATGVGAIPVFFLGDRATTLQPLLLGIAAGVMGVASVAGLIVPGLDQGPAATVGAGIATGVAFLLAAERLLEIRDRHLSRPRSQSLTTSILVFVVLLVHSLPEGFAIGTAYASDTAGLGLFVIVAIAIQNVPEGTSVAIPMAAAGFSRSRQFWAAVATSLPQPIGALIAYLLVREISSVLPFSFGFAAGAMLALIATELIPQAWRENAVGCLAGLLAGAAVMLGLSFALGV
jgi:ZIP family zinc transporter